MPFRKRAYIALLSVGFLVLPQTQPREWRFDFLPFDAFKRHPRKSYPLRVRRRRAEGRRLNAERGDDLLIQNGQRRRVPAARPFVRFRIQLVRVEW